MTEQEKQKAISDLERMDPERLRLSLIYLSTMAQASPLPLPLPKPVTPVHLQLVSNAGR